MAESSLEAQIDLAKIQTHSEIKNRDLGMYLGFASLTILVLAAVYCAAIGQPFVAAGFMAVGAIGTVGKFILGRNQSDDGLDKSKKQRRLFR